MRGGGGRRGCGMDVKSLFFVSWRLGCVGVAFRIECWCWCGFQRTTHCRAYSKCIDGLAYKRSKAVCIYVYILNAGHTAGLNTSERDGKTK